MFPDQYIGISAMEYWPAFIDMKMLVLYNYTQKHHDYMNLQED